MPHVSKNKLPSQTIASLQKDLFSLLTDGLRADARKRLLRELLTDTEVVMLAKRLALVRKLAQRESQYEILVQLKISTSTAGRYQQKLEEGGFAELARVLVSKRRSVDFWDRLEEALFIVPPVVGGARYRKVRARARRRKQLSA